ncbi:amidohydrolase [Chloroflexota bacterium]
MAADLILRNADVVTLDPQQPKARLVAIKGDKILLVAGNDEEECLKGAGTNVIDCHGKTVVPGFNDAHCHLFSFIRKLLSLDIGPSSVSSINDIKVAIRRQTQYILPGGWLTGTGFNEFHLAEKRYPNRWDIDEVAPLHPVVLIHRSLHACVLNSLALSLAGITAQTTEPSGGHIDREPSTGEPTGLLFEMLSYIRERVMPPLTEEELRRGVALANRQYLTNGITSLQEATMGNGLDRWQSLRQLKDAGQLTSRVSMMFGTGALSRFQEMGLVTGSGDVQLRLGGMKIMLTGTSGQLQPQQLELNQQAFKANRAGFQLAIHAVEECTVTAAIMALEYIASRLPITGQRHRIEHCSECSHYLLQRLVEMKAVIVTQPSFIYYSGDRYLATVLASQQQLLYRIKSLSDSGLIVAGSSDSPVVSHNPLVGIYAAVTRRTDSGHQLLSEECIMAEQALEMYTINAAYASGEENIKGSITPGKLADIVVLSDNPLNVSQERIKDIMVEMTIIGGKVAWEV